MEYRLKINESEFNVFYLGRVSKRLVKNALRGVIKLAYNSWGSSNFNYGESEGNNRT